MLQQKGKDGRDREQRRIRRNLELYERVVATNPEVKRKGKTMPYTSYSGHMFSFLTKEGKLALRLSDEDRVAFVKKCGTEPVVSYGAVMKE